MGRITDEMVERSFEVAKRIYLNQVSRKEGLKILTDIGLNENSAADYIYNYSCLIQGKLFSRTTNSYATEYYLQKIYEENELEGLQNALLSLSQHIDYYEEKSGTTVNKRKEIYNQYLKLIVNKIDPVVYPDEVDKELEYAEGKTKKVLVNNYERNQLARKKCIEHFGITCQICGFNFQDNYGELGKDFIHVHHLVDISSIGNEYSVNPVKDLIPVCPNCHAMLHKRKPAYSIEELKQIRE